MLYIPRLVHALSEDDPDRRLEFCDQVWNKSRIWKFNCFVEWNHFKINHNYVHHWSNTNPHVTEQKPVNLQGLTGWCGVLSGGIVWSFFQVTVTAIHLQILQIPAVDNIYVDEGVYYQQYGAALHFHSDVRGYLDN